MRRSVVLSLLVCMVVGFAPSGGHAPAFASDPISATQVLQSGVLVPGEVDPDCAVTDGTVYAIAPDGSGGVYIGGEFGQVGTASGTLLSFDSTNGGVERGVPKVDGEVRAVAPDGSGGVYIVGAFTHVAAVDGPTLAARGLDEHQRCVAGRCESASACHQVAVVGDFCVVDGARAAAQPIGHAEALPFLK